MSLSRSVGPSVRRLVGPKSRKNLNSKLSALVFDRDLGFSRGHQSDGKDEDEEEVKDDKDDNREAKEVD